VVAGNGRFLVSFSASGRSAAVGRLHSACIPTGEGAMPFPLDERWVRAAEQALGKRFPDAYRDRLMRDNGGEIEAAGEEWSLYPIRDQSNRRRTKRTCNHVLQETKSALSWAGFPSDAVAIASNGSGDLLLFLPDGRDSTVFGSCVYLWNHETREVEPVAEFGELEG
jgi:hypothetical protein